ncbi:metallophosphoesterase family protein [Salisediminibacterium selenitireducens]|uniref:Metallophosphoesterase n=1 Tax=Bacillus selenitireducens (strain ATCC 700615 / DSM 15326 / MLS10) TaxID=439292 RepID=D6XUV2_BACIE|nr:metallophosphoesterase family protein [Salisediminibacterium selenitireducens]ADH99588.1 metallophosphoesterase [[Bacillus] selenitireducens MLS10]
MRLALLSDIHGNEAALRAVLEDLSRKNASHVAVLGDISYRGPKPKECLDLIRELHGKVIKGNADEWLIRGIREGELPQQAFAIMQREQAWSYGKMTDEGLHYLNQLPTELEIPLTNRIQLYATHAFPDDLFKVIPEHAENSAFDAFFEHNPRAMYYAYGHIHIPHMRNITGNTLLNTGSIGLPFDGNPDASYVMLERTNDSISTSFHRVAYDIEKAVFDLKDTDYPEDAAPLLESIYRTGKKP